jgi:membrane protease YdiL (CAAX protease family)
LSLGASLLLQHSVFFLPPLIVYASLNRSFNFIPVKPLSGRNIIYIILISFAMQPVMGIISFISSVFFGTLDPALEEYIGGHPVTSIFLIGLMPAITEELTLRGVILSNYRSLHIKQAAIINGLFFGIIHFSYTQFFYAFFCGIIFSYMVHYTGSILASMLAHFLINSSQVMLSSILGSILSGSSAGMTVPYTSYKDAILSTLTSLFIFIIILLFLIFRFIKSNKIHNVYKESVLDYEDKHNYHYVFNLEFMFILILFFLFSMR